MSKKKGGPAAGGVAVAEATAPVADGVAAAAPAARKTGPRFVSVEVPIPAGDPKNYCPRHLDVQLTPEQSRGLRRVFDGLHGRAMKLRSERYVQTPADAVRWILEQVELAAGA